MRSIPVVTKNLLIINILAYLAKEALNSSINFNDIFGLHFILASDFRIYQLVTYMFMHASFQHLFFNMFALWMFGCVIENVWGAKKYLFYYIACGIGAGLFQELAQYVSYIVNDLSAVDMINMNGMSVSVGAYLNLLTTVGASGAVYALLLAFGMTFPEDKIFVFPLPIPIKAKWFVAIYAALSLVMAMTTTGDNVAHFAHLGGMVFGFFLIKYWRKHPYGGSSRDSGQQFFGNLRHKWEKRSHHSAKQNDVNTPVDCESDWDYNARKQHEQQEIDAILDKIRKSGYDSLSGEEKRKLFENSHRK